MKLAGSGHGSDAAVQPMEPPRINFVNAESCSDAQHATNLVHDMLAHVRAPTRGWAVTIRVGQTAAGALRAEADISDGAGDVVAHRALSGDDERCAGLARAVGVWASLVLEKRRASEALESEGDDASDSSSQPSLQRSNTSEPASAVDAEPARTARRFTKPLAETATGADDDAIAFAVAAQHFELGTSAFVMSNPSAATAFGGISEFASIDIFGKLSVRPALLVGETFSPDPKSGFNGTWMAARLDGCMRLRLGTRYEIDPCFGGEAGSTRFITAVPYAGVGGALDLRRYMGNQLMLTLRGVTDVGVMRNDPPLSARGELVMSCWVW